MASNLSLVRKAFTDLGRDMDSGVRAARDEMMAAVIQLSKEEIKGQRGKGEKATPGQPPMNVTGNLRRSIRGERFTTGFANYSAIVGPTMEYSRAVELGGKYAPKSWRGTSAMQGFPYMSPAFKKFESSGLLQAILVKNLVR